MPKHPSETVQLDRLQESYGAPLFKVALRRFISTTNDRNQSRQQLEESLWRIHLPFTRLPVWHVIKFTRYEPISGTRPTADMIHVKPASYDKRQRPIPGRFDTALINDGTGTGLGIKGESECPYSCVTHSTLNRIPYWPRSCRILDSRKVSQPTFRARGDSATPSGLCSVVLTTD